MNADPRTKTRVDVPPAKAKPPRFRIARVGFAGIILLFTGLGLWKAYELIVSWLTWYESRRGLVNAALVLLALAIFIGALVFVLNTFRARREPDLPLFPQDAGTLHDEHERWTALRPADGDAPSDPLRTTGRKQEKPSSGQIHGPRSGEDGDPS